MLRTARRAARAAACAAALALAATAGLATSPAPADAARACPGADAVPTAAGLDRARAATLCLVNAERTKRHVKRLRSHRALRTSAQSYASDMARRDFFAHTSPAGAGLLARVRASGGYVARGHAVRVGENLAWGSGGRATPRSIVKAWMASPGHRANLLDRDFRESGLGIALGAPVAGGVSGPAATYTHHLGRRR